MLNTKELIDKHRHINVDYEDWFEAVYEGFIEKLEKLGIDTTAEDMCFSGFWSQGDGASFTGYIHRDNMQKFMEEHALNLVYPAAYYFAKRKELSAKLVRSSSHYCHENTVQADLNDDYIFNDYDGDDPRGDIYEAMEKAFNIESREFEEKVQTICRGWMKHLYRALEDEYDYLTSDDVVLESIKANLDSNLLTEGEENGIRSY